MNQTSTQTLLLELGCEELPAGSVAGMAQGLASAVHDLLDASAMLEPAAAMQTFHTPRRLALQISAVRDQQPDQQIIRRGPAVSASFDGDGKPTKAAEGFARSVGASVEQLQRLQTDQGEWLMFEQHQPGRSLSELLQDELAAILKRLPMPKTMRWGDHELRFLRPVHWLLALHGELVIPLQLAHLQAANTTFGHRVHAPEPLRIDRADAYVEPMQQASVMVEPTQRRAAIEKQVASICSENNINVFNNVANAKADYEALLNEVCALNEWPVALLCSFDSQYLQLPDEVLSLSMRTQQKFFPLYDESGALSAQFIAVANLDSKDPEQVIAGYQRVIEPRLSDAAFFWDKDRQQPLAAYADALDNISFQQQLGSVGDKARRMRTLVGWVAGQLSSEQKTCQRAAELALCDLSTDMVGEFPELQGTMGRYYALACGESEAVADAIEQHYQPRGAGDSIADSRPGQCLAITEKCDRLLGIFAAGKKPDGNKDPFALRRAALGLVRTIIDGQLRLNLDDLLHQSANVLAPQIAVSDDSIADVRQFILDRLQSWLEQQGIGVLTFRAVAAVTSHDLLELFHRARAFESAYKSHNHALQSLAAASKRVNNLISKLSVENPLSSGIAFDLKLATDQAETELHAASRLASSQLSQVLESADSLEKDYNRILDDLADLQAPVDAFFENVMVMADDANVRKNRLRLLKELDNTIKQFADLSKLNM